MHPPTHGIWFIDETSSSHLNILHVEHCAMLIHKILYGLCQRWIEYHIHVQNKMLIHNLCQYSSQLWMQRLILVESIQLVVDDCVKLNSFQDNIAIVTVHIKPSKMPMLSKEGIEITKMVYLVSLSSIYPS